MAEDGQKKRPPQPREPAPRRSRKPEPGALQETDIPVALRSRLEHVARPLHVPIHIGLPPGLPPQPIDGIPHPPPERLPAPLPRPRPRTWITRTVRLQFIATTNTIAFDPQLLVPVVTAMNGFFGPGKIEFVYDPARDFVVEDNTLLDQDWELVDVGSLSNPESIPPTVDDTRFHKERQRVAAQHIGKLVVYISLGSNLEWQGTGGWAVRERGFHYSSTSADYVATAAVYWRPPGGSIDPNTLAHEIGHYLHEFHTMGYMPTTIAAAADSIRTAVDSWGWSRNQALRVFDADYPFVIDTPPDPGPDLFAAANGAACGGPDYVDVPVTFANGSQQTFRIEPDRTNLMSYFKGCPGIHGFSTGQFLRMRVALEHGNRNHLLAGYGSWIPAPPAVVATPGGVPGVVVLDVTSSPWFGTWTSEDAVLRPSWHWLGGYLESVTCTSDTPGNVDVAARAVDGGVYHKSLRAGAWTPEYSWSRVGTVVFAGDPVLVSWGPGRLDLFAVDANGSLEWSTNTGTGWSGWTSIGTAVMGAPAVVCSQPHRIDVVAWQTDLSLRHSSYDGSHWSAWQSLSGVVDAPPALASLAPGRLDLIARGTDHAIYHKWMMLAGWSPSWEYMGGDFVGTHAIVATSGNRLDIVARAADDSVWHKEWNGASWVPGVTQWRPLGGTIVDSPRLLSSPAGAGRRLDVFSRARDGSLLHAALDPSGGQVPGALSFTPDPFPTGW